MVTQLRSSTCASLKASRRIKAHFSEIVINHSREVTRGRAKRHAKLDNLTKRRRDIIWPLEDALAFASALFSWKQKRRNIFKTEKKWKGKKVIIPSLYAIRMTLCRLLFFLLHAEAPKCRHGAVLYANSARLGKIALIINGLMPMHHLEKIFFVARADRCELNGKKRRTA